MQQAVEHALADTVKGDGENPSDFGKEASLINSHLSDEQVHQLIKGYSAMTAEQQETFKAKMVVGGKEYEAEKAKSHTVGGSSVLNFIKKAYKDSQ